MVARRTLLDAFRGEMRDNVIEFGKRLWEMDSDVYIFMARKAACFFDCQREQKLAGVRGLAVSDRVLDMDLSFLRDKRVTLVDDCVFSGTTLFHAKTVVERANAASCNTLTLSVNRDWIRPQLLPGGSEANLLNFVEPLLQLDDSQSVQQCYDIVRAISIFPRPYDVDFPHTKTIKMSQGGLEQLLRTPGWEPFDVSSSFQTDHDVRVFTVLPSDGFKASFFREHAGLESIAQAVKLRLYTKKLSAKTWSVRLVPIVVLGALDQADLLTDGCWGVELNATLSAAGFSSPKSRYRLLQFLLSTSLLRSFAGFASADTTPLDVEVRKDLAEMAFGSRYSDFIDEANYAISNIALPRAVAEPPSATTSAFDRKQVKVSTPGELVAECVKPFTWLYRELEIPARTVVRDSGLQQSLDQTRPELVRLGRGFSLRTLTDRLSSDEIDVQRFATIFLDRAIDLGIAVPTIVEDGGTIYRAFRHGEDAVFGEAEERLTALALQAYMDSRGIGSIYGLELQKFVVLFAQIAIREGSLMERLDVTESVTFGCQVLSVKGHLHGPVPTLVVRDASGEVGAPFVDGNTYPAPWLTQIWQRRDILRVDPGGLGPLGPGDILNPSALVSRLQDPSDKVSQVLVAGLSAETKQILEAWSTDKGDPSAPLLRSLLADINALTAQGEIWQNIELQSCATSEFARNWCRKPPLGKPKRAQFSRLLVEEGFSKHINRRDSGTKYVIGEMPDLQVGPRKEAKARRIGRLLGKLVGKRHAFGPRPLNNDTDLVMLSTCTEGDHQVRALSGELAILQLRLRDALNSASRLARKRDYSAAKQLLRNHYVYIAANSGAMKYRWFVNQELPKLLNAVTSYCREADPSGELQDEWLEIWPDAVESILSSVSPVTRMHIDAMGRWLIAVNVALRLFMLWMSHAASKAPASDVDVKQAVADLLEWCRHFREHNGSEAGEMRSIVAEASTFVQPLDINRLAALCRRAAETLSGQARHDFSQLLDDSRLLCESFGAVGEFRPYPYALYFDAGSVTSQPGRRLDAELRMALTELADNSYRLLEGARNPWFSGQWILLRGNRGSTTAAELCSRLAQKCVERKIPFRAVLVARMSYQDSVRDMSGSLKVADTEFLRRMSSIRSLVLPDVLRNEIVCLQDASSVGLQEASKVAAALKVSAPLESEVDTLQSKSTELPTREYLMTRFKLAVTDSSATAKATVQEHPVMTRAKYNTVEELKGRVDVGIITIRVDESDAVLRRFPTRRHVVGHEANYFAADIVDAQGRDRVVAIARSTEQGQGPAQALATAMIDELNPAWLLVVGIAGGLPDAEYSLGDVLLSVRMNDFSVTAYAEGKSPTFQDTGAPVDFAVQKLLSTINGVHELSNWSDALGVATPSLDIPTLGSDELYGAPEWKQSVVDSLKQNFPAAPAVRKPKFHPAIMITSNTLVKDTGLAKQWKQSARSAAGVEMELGGVARAAYSKNKGTKVLAVRGLSDIIGYKRSPDWTGYACSTAAAFADALTRSGFIGLPAGNMDARPDAATQSEEAATG